jgi:hypothetical protein
VAGRPAPSAAKPPVRLHRPARLALSIQGQRLAVHRLQQRRVLALGAFELHQSLIEQLLAEIVLPALQQKLRELRVAGERDATGADHPPGNTDRPGQRCHPWGQRQPPARASARSHSMHDVASVSLDRTAFEV